MKGKFIFALVAAAAAVIVISALLKSPTPDSPQASLTVAPESSLAPAQEGIRKSSRSVRLAESTRGRTVESATAPGTWAPSPDLISSTNKLERLTQIREAFKSLAAGDRVAAMRAAKELKDVNERE